MNIETVLSHKYAIEYFKKKPRCIIALCPLLPTMYRDENKNLVITGNQHVFLGKAVNAYYGIVETTANVRLYRHREFFETNVNKLVVTGKSFSDCAKKLVE